MKEKQKIVLIVDDIELNRAILCELFHTNYRILEAENGQAALDLVAQHGSEIAVILLDIIMPVLDGIEVLQVMKAERWIDRIPIILITAENNEDIALKGYNMGVSDIINKPFNPDIVIRRVENVIELYDHKLHLENRVQEQMNTLEAQALKLRQTNMFVIDTLSTVVEFRSCESGSHIKRIRAITQVLLEALATRYEEYQFSQETIDTIASASAMHDIGKIAIPDSVLLKPGKLTAEEFEIMKTHAIRGCEILQSLHCAQDEDYYSYCYEICRHHHERWDGNGYPDHLRGAQISIWAQVVSLADVYEALISERVYKPAYSHLEAVSMIARGECGVFNPQLLKCFLEIVDLLREEVSRASETLRTLGPGGPALLTPPKRESDALSDRTLWLLELEREKYRVLADMSGEIVFDYEARTDLLQFSEKYVDVFGGHFQIRDAISSVKTTDRLSQQGRAQLFSCLAELSPAQPDCKLELPIRTASGTFEWFDVRVKALWRTETQPECAGLVGKLTNIHAAKLERQKLWLRANTDPLTALSNRSATEDSIIHYLQRGVVHNGALMFMDVDNFKAVNDTFGHQFGDVTLQRIGDELKQMFRSTDVIGRIGGDEFVVYLSNVESTQTLEQKASMVCKTLHNAFQHMGQSCIISVSVGVARYPKDGTSYPALLSKADEALYYAKQSGKNRFAIYDKISMQQKGVLSRAPATK